MTLKCANLSADHGITQLERRRSLIQLPEQVHSGERDNPFKKAPGHLFVCVCTVRQLSATGPWETSLIQGGIQGMAACLLSHCDVWSSSCDFAPNMSLNANGDDNDVIIHARVSRLLHTSLRACLLLWKPEHQKHLDILPGQRSEHSAVYYLCSFAISYGVFAYWSVTELVSCSPGP